jgi:hypothetical protein
MAMAMATGMGRGKRQLKRQSTFGSGFGAAATVVAMPQCQLLSSNAQGARILIASTVLWKVSR